MHLIVIAIVRVQGVGGAIGTVSNVSPLMLRAQHKYGIHESLNMYTCSMEPFPYRKSPIKEDKGFYYRRMP